jgi:NAD(P)-dependent dehydrogenase (short-subunit alcohol dehydrogenase family)
MVRLETAGAPWLWEERMSFEDKVAVITGSGGGIGEAYAKALAAEGARVVVAEIQAEAGERVAEEICKGGGEASFVEVDVASPESTLAMAEAVTRRYGGIDLLVNNAAIYGGMKLAGLLGVDWDYYKRFMDVNLHGALLCVRACHGSMRERGGGAIVNQSSAAAWMAAGYYGIAKLGLNGITQSLARELGPAHIRVNAIAPGPIDTEATRGVVPKPILEQIIGSMPLRRQGTTDDLIGACLFLLSDAAAWITGQVLSVDGGQMMRP